MGHEGHESHEQHAFTSPYPCGVAGLVKKRGILAAPEHPFSLLLINISDASRLLGLLHSFRGNSQVPEMQYVPINLESSNVIDSH